MLHPTTHLLRLAQETFSANVLAILEARGMSKAKFAKEAVSKGVLSKKTVYNVLNAANPPKLETYAEVARLLHVPLWVLLLDDLPERVDLKDPTALKRLVRLMDNYLQASDTGRKDIETVAEGEAIKQSRSRS